MNPRRSNAREEIAQIEPQHKAFARVRRGVAADRPTAAKPVRCRVRRNVIDDVGKYPALHFLEPRLGNLKEPESTAALGAPHIAVMP